VLLVGIHARERNELPASQKDDPIQDDAKKFRMLRNKDFWMVACEFNKNRTCSWDFHIDLADERELMVLIEICAVVQKFIQTLKNSVTIGRS
jgi:hypothetical protein